MTEHDRSLRNSFYEKGSDARVMESDLMRGDDSLPYNHLAKGTSESSIPNWEDEPPPQKLVNFEQLEAEANAIAERHKVSAAPPNPKLLIDCHEQNCRVLQESLGAWLVVEPTAGRTSQSAAVLQAGYDVIREQLHVISRSLRRIDVHGLLGLERDSLPEFPRIFAVASALLASTNGYLDGDVIQRFVRGYQRAAPLTILELQTLQLALRFALVNHLRTLIQRVTGSYGEFKVESLIGKSYYERHKAQVEETKFRDRHLQDRGLSSKGDFRPQLSLGTAKGSIETTPCLGGLGAFGTNFSLVVSSFRHLSGIDWQALFDRVSLVDLTLKRDPANIYALMDGATLDSYRQVIQLIAKGTNSPEVDIARRAVEVASEAKSSSPKDVRRAHVGYYLIDQGRPILEQRVGYISTWQEWTIRLIKQYAIAFYFTLLLLISALVFTAPLVYAIYEGASLPILALLAVLLLAPASTIAVCTLQLVPICEPSLLPKLDFYGGVVEEAQTFVVVPAVLTSKADVTQLLEKLETHYLANQDPNIYFALLGDWSDAPQEQMADDEVVVKEAALGVELLNGRYRDGSHDRFYFFHRRRQWNPSQGKWIGWERKRGKLREFNRLLRGAHDTNFINCTADGDFLARTRYVITLDSDTELLRDAARRLIGTIHHPLNRPRVGAVSGRVVSGYVIIQPRIFFANSKAKRSELPGIISHIAQNNSYSTTAFDVYQDLFGEGRYIGKGLYDVDTFEAALKGRVPENSILSHDVYEGLYARAALVTDVLLFEGEVDDYRAGLRRMHRWTRGDWQLLPWIFPYVRDEQGNSVRNILPLASRWKILDPLRRSLLFPATLLWLLASWTVFPGSPLLWTACGVLYFGLSISLWTIKYREQPRVLSPLGSREARWSDVKQKARAGTGAVKNVLFSISCLALESFTITDAVLRSIYRVYISRKNLLDWVATAQNQAESGATAITFFRLMWPALPVALTCGVLVQTIRPGAMIVATPFLLSWISSPLIAYRLSQRQHNRSAVHEERTGQDLRLRARRVWQLLLENHDHQLSTQADNGQASDGERLSPAGHTRLLLWTMAARALGVIGIFDLERRIERLVSLIEESQGCYSPSRHSDRRVSRLNTEPIFLYVESGNLAAHLRCFQLLVDEIMEQPLLGEQELQGLADTLGLIKQAAGRITAKQLAQRERSVTLAEFMATLKERTMLFEEFHKNVEYCATLLREAQHRPLTAFSGWHRLLVLLEDRFNKMQSNSHLLQSAINEDNTAELSFWISHLGGQMGQFRQDLLAAAPWLRTSAIGTKPRVEGNGTTPFERWSQINDALDNIQIVSQIPEHYTLALLDLSTLRMELEASLLATSTGLAPTPEMTSTLIDNIEEAVATFERVISDLAGLTDRSAPLFESAGYRIRFDREYHAELEMLRVRGLV